MSFLRKLRAPFVRFTGLFRGKQHEAEMSEELRAHLDGLIERNVAAGMPPEEARHAALRTFGGVAQIAERARDERRSAWGEQGLQDVRYGCRALRKTPGFTAVVIFTLALGIGACTAVFSVIDGVLLHPIDLPDADRIVMLRESRPPDLPDFPVSPPTFLDWEKQAKSFESMAAARPASPNFSGANEPRRLTAMRVTPRYFDVFGGRPVRGRGFLPEECEAGNDRVVVLSHAFWQRTFAGAEDVIGRQIQLDAEPHLVVGIAPPRFNPGGNDDLWLPLAFSRDEHSNLRGYHVLSVAARLRPGVTAAQANAEMKIISRRLVEQFPETKDWSAFAMPVQHHRQRDLRTVLFTLLGAVGCVLLVACANIANLLLARGTVRQREVSVRAALGASRGRIVRQLLTESLLLALAGGAAGVLVGWWGLAGLRALAPASLPRVSEIGIHGGVLACALALTLITGAVFGLAPAWLTARVNVSDALKKGAASATDTGGRRRLRGALIVFEVAAALVLLTGAGLLARSFIALEHVGPGFEPKQAIALELSLPERRYAQPEQRVAFINGLLEQFARVPGVESAGITDALSLLGGSAAAFGIHGREVRRTSELPLTMFYSVSADYFPAMSIRLRRGRLLSASDDARAPSVVVINEAFAQQHFAGADPLGKTLQLSVGRKPCRIVGVVANVTQSGVDRVTTAQTYGAFAQWPTYTSTFTVVVRATTPAPVLLPALRAAVYALDPHQPLGNVRKLEDVVEAIVARQRFATTLLGLFSLVALIIAAVGIYGVTAYHVSQRTMEIGIRVALGASRRDVLRLVLAQGLKLIGLGLLAGFAGTWAASRAIRSMLYNTSVHDPLTLTAIGLLLTGVAFVACLVPARRATKVDPMVALRAE